MPRLAALTLLLTGAVPAAWAQTPEDDPRATLVAMGERIAAVQSYAATVERVTEVTIEDGQSTTTTLTHLALERPNRIRTLCDRPEGETRVLCDGDRLVVWTDELGTVVDQPAPDTLAEIDSLTEGLATEGLALAALYLSESPVEDLIAGYDGIHDLGTGVLGDATCRLIGLDASLGVGQRLLLWIDTETLLPRQIVVDATSMLRETLTAQSVDSHGARVTVTERHLGVTVNREDLDFEIDMPETP